MRSSGVVYKKLRELKFRHLVELYKKFLRRAPDLCQYNRTFRVESNNTVRVVSLCWLHQPPEGVQPHLLDICDQVGHCQDCNAFVCRFTKESVQKAFEKELEDPKIKAKKYPDICALEWVLEQSVSGIPPFTWIQKAYYDVKRRLVKKAL